MVCEYPLLILKDNRNLVFEVHNNILWVTKVDFSCVLCQICMK
jgi:hypothetical protein